MPISQVESYTKDPSVDRQELDNVKLLCAQVLKGHKKLARQLELFQSQLHSKAACSSEKSSTAARQVLATLKEEQQQQLRIQLIAMEMKERAFGARAKQMEEHCLRSFNEQLVQWKKSQDVSHQREDDVSEMQRNVQFRRDFSRRIGPSRLEEEENQYGQEVVLVEHKHVPVVFATNAGDVAEVAPLNMTSVSSIDEDSDDSKMVEPSSSPPRRSRGVWRYPIDRESSVRRSCFSL
jgi:broad specificity phosphatase PhoE